MSSKIIFRQRGFTLIEMVMTIVLLGIIAAVLAPILSTTIGGFHAARTRSDLTDQARLVMERLTREIREASPDPADITVGAGGTSLQFNQLTGLVGLADNGINYTKTYSACRTVQVSTAGNLLNWDDDNDGNADAILTSNLNRIIFDYSPGTMINSGVVSIELSLDNNGETINVYREIHIRNTGACP